MTKVIAIVNPLGGTGRTTTAVFLAAALAAGGRRVILVDADPQGEALRRLGIGREALGVAPDAPRRAVRAETAFPGLDAIPSVISQTDARRWSAKAAGSLDGLLPAQTCPGGAYDFAVIDTPPGMGTATVGAMAAADGVLISTRAFPYEAEAIEDLLDSCGLAKASPKPGCQALGLLPTKRDWAVARAAADLAALRGRFGGLVLGTVVPRWKRPPEPGDSPVYRAVVGEVLRRLRRCH